MRTLHVGIIEDEFLARETLKAFLEQHCEKVEVLFLAPDLESGIAKINELRPQAIFLDIEMPGHSGMEIRQLLGDTEPPHIVFTTAYANYAVDAFGLEAVDYLLKPIDITKLRRAVERIRERSELKEGSLSRSVSIPTSNGQRVIKLEDILYLKADGSYTEVHTTTERHLVSRKLIEMHELLEEDVFVRLHRSYVVNMTQVVEFIRQTNSFVRMSNNAMIPVARRSKDAVKQYFLDL